MYNLWISDSMDCIKKNVDTLFSKADKMNSDELETNFMAIMKEGEKSVEQSGKKKKIIIYFLLFLLFYNILIFDFRRKSSISQSYA